MSRSSQLNLSCGQSDIHPRALEAMSQPIPSPIYYPPFAEMEGRCISLLRRLMHTDNDVLLVTGSATYGEEGAFTSILETDDLCVTVNAGIFGQVLTDLVRAIGARAVEITVRPGSTVSVDQVRSTLKSNPDAKMLSIVHIETTAGSANPVSEIGMMLRREFPHILFMVDAVSSFGSLPLRVDEWRIDICCTSSQKCLNAPQGVAMVSVSERAWRIIEGRSSVMPGLCLDLITWRRWHVGVEGAREAEARRGSDNRTATDDQIDTSYTEYKAAHGPSGSYVLMNALLASLQAIDDEGEEAVLKRHADTGRAFRSGVRALGLTPLAAEVDAAPCSTCVVMPGDFFDVQEYMRTIWEEFGIATAGGSPTSDVHGYVGSRVGFMGFVANSQSVYELLEAMEEVLPRFGVPVRPGVAVAAAEAAFRDES